MEAEGVRPRQGRGSALEGCWSGSGAENQKRETMWPIVGSHRRIHLFKKKKFTSKFLKKFIRFSESDREGMSSLCWLTPQLPSNSQGQTSSKPGSGTFFWVSPVGTWVILCPFSRHISREQDLNQHLCESLLLQAVVSPLRRPSTLKT